MKEASTIEVYCRIKPRQDDTDPSYCIELIDGCNIKCVPPSLYRNSKETKFNFSRVFTECATQQDVFDEVAFPLIVKLLNGYNGLLCTYGVTGSGKSHTVFGDNDPGIIPRTLKALFRRIRPMDRFRLKPNGLNSYVINDVLIAKELQAKYRGDFSRRSQDMNCKSYMERVVDDDEFLVTDLCNCAVFVTMIEIYEKRIVDLLDAGSDKKTITLRDDKNKIKYPHGAMEYEVLSADEALSYYFAGLEKRKVAATSLNAESSRSHVIFNIKLVQMNNDSVIPLMLPSGICQTNNSNTSSIADDHSVVITPQQSNKSVVNTIIINDTTLPSQPQQLDNSLTVSYLSIVDLAGCESNKKANNNTERSKEANNINQSLLTLKRCFDKIREKQKGMKNILIPFRDNDLTYLFRDSLDGNAAIRMIICIKSNSGEYSETMRVLEFAESSQEVKLKTEKDIQKINIERVPIISPMSVESNAKVDELNSEDDDDEIMREFQKKMESFKIPEGVTLTSLENTEKLLEFFDFLPKPMGVLERTIEDMGDVISEQMDKIETMEQEMKRISDRLKRSQGEVLRFSDKYKRLQDDLIKVTTERDDYKAKFKHFDDQARAKIQKVDRDLLYTNTGASSRLNTKPQVKDLAAKFESINASAKTVGRFERSKPMTASTTKTINKYQNYGHFNQRYRKSKSAEKWVQHKEKHEIPQGTLHDVSMKFGTSSPNPKKTDLQKNDKYMLQHQTVDDSGNLTTSVYKGNIIPSAGGGVCVDLYEKETVSQGPVIRTQGRKRSSSISVEVRTKRPRDSFDVDLY